jgi:hypothetical protein
MAAVIREVLSGARRRGEPAWRGQPAVSGSRVTGRGGHWCSRHRRWAQTMARHGDPVDMARCCAPGDLQPNSLWSGHRLRRGIQQLRAH